MFYIFLHFTRIFVPILNILLCTIVFYPLYEPNLYGRRWYPTGGSHPHAIVTSRSAHAP